MLPIGKGLNYIYFSSCVFVWKLPLEFTEVMCQRMMNMGRMVQQPLTPQEIRSVIYQILIFEISIELFQFYKSTSEIV